MPHKGWFYKVEGLTEDMKKWNNWYGKLDEVRGGTIVKCLENLRGLNTFDTQRVRVQLCDGSIKYVFAFQIEDSKVKGW